MIRTSDNNSYVNQNPVVVEAAAVEVKEFVTITGVDTFESENATFTFSGKAKTGATISGISFDNNEKTYTNGGKFDSNGLLAVTLSNELIFASNSTYTLNLLCGISGTGSRSLYYSYDSSFPSNNRTSISHSFTGNNKAEIISISNLDTSKTLYIKKNSSETWVFEAQVVYSIDTNISEEEIQAGYVNDAIKAIELIGNVEYTTSSMTLINNAKIAIDKCSSTENITNIETYNNAVSYFNELSENARNQFVNSVDNIGDELSIESKTLIDIAYENYDNLLPSDKENSEVVNKYNQLNEIKISYDEIAYSSYDKKINISYLETKSFANGKYQLGNSIFYVNTYEKEMVIENSSTIIDGVEYSKRLKTGGKSDFDNTVRLVEFKTSVKGTIKVACLSGSDAEERTLTLWDESGTQLTTIKAAKTAADAKIESFNLDVTGTFSIGSSNNVSIYYLEFVPAQLNYQYDNDDAPTAVRFIGTITNLADYKTIESITLSFKLGTNEADVNITKLYTSVANTFEAVDNTYYVCYAITEITAAIGQSFEATLTVTFNNGNEALTQTRSFTLGE